MALSLTLLSAPGTLLLLLGCLVQPGSEDFCLVLLYIVLSCLDVVFERPALFRRGNGEEGDLGEKEG